jgi:hypothetical protein
MVGSEERAALGVSRVARGVEQVIRSATRAPMPMFRRKERTSPTSNVPAEPFSSEPSWIFNAGTMVSGSGEIAGKAESFKDVVKETGSGGSEVWVVES